MKLNELFAGVVKGEIYACECGSFAAYKAIHLLLMTKSCIEHGTPFPTWNPYVPFAPITEKKLAWAVRTYNKIRNEMEMNV